MQFSREKEHFKQFLLMLTELPLVGEAKPLLHTSSSDSFRCPSVDLLASIFLASDSLINKIFTYPALFLHVLRYTAFIPISFRSLLELKFQNW